MAFAAQPARAGSSGGGVEILDMAMLFDGKIGEQAADMAKMSKEGAADVHMVSFFLVPEGNPPFDKISLYEEKYRLDFCDGENALVTGSYLLQSREEEQLYFMLRQRFSMVS